MNNTHANSHKNVAGFWTRLALAVEAMSESDGERLEKRIRRLEAEVERLSGVQDKRAKA